MRVNKVMSFPYPYLIDALYAQGKRDKADQVLALWIGAYFGPIINKVNKADQYPELPMFATPVALES